MLKLIRQTNSTGFKSLINNSAAIRLNHGFSFGNSIVILIYLKFGYSFLFIK
jgi:hypothetical protein